MDMTMAAVDMVMAKTKSPNNIPPKTETTFMKIKVVFNFRKGVNHVNDLPNGVSVVNNNISSLQSDNTFTLIHKS